MPLRPIAIVVLTLGLATPASANRARGHFNHLGMSFPQETRVASSRRDGSPPTVMFCAWSTTVREFSKFVAATGYRATADMLSLGRDGWKARGHTWRNPGFRQRPNHPVVGVSYHDALEFCRWLTRRERRLGGIDPQECYRLPTDDEWQALIVWKFPNRKYAWGDTWPPPPKAGNFAGEEMRASPDWPEGWECIAGFRDGFVGTAPVSVSSGKAGVADLSGNVWQWTSTPFHKELNSVELRAKYPFLDSDMDSTGKPSKVIRGGCWNDYFPGLLELNTRGAREPHNRNSGLGFRIVLAPGDVPND